MLVCKRWRDTIIITPRLWSKIYFGFLTGPRFSKMASTEGMQVCRTSAEVQAAVARTGSAPLYIMVEIAHMHEFLSGARVNCTHCCSTFKQLAQSDMERWSSLQVIHSYIHPPPSGLFRGHFSSLRELSIVEGLSGEFWAHEVLPDAPALEAVSITLNTFGSQLLSKLVSYPSLSRLRRLAVSVTAMSWISTKEFIQNSPNLEELTLSPANLTGVEVTPASSQFLCRLTLYTAGLPRLPPILASLPVLSYLKLICNSRMDSTPPEFITLPALQQLSIIGQFQFLPCILAPKLYSLHLEQGPYFLSPESFMNAAWSTTRAHSHMLQPSRLTIVDVYLQSKVLLMILKQNPQLTTFNLHGGLPRANFFRKLALGSEDIAPLLENIYLREMVEMTLWKVIRPSVMAIVRARHGPGKPLKSLFCISSSGGEETATGREFCV